MVKSIILLEDLITEMAIYIIQSENSEKPSFAGGLSLGPIVNHHLLYVYA